MDRLLCNRLCRTRLPYVVVAKARNVLFISFFKVLKVLKVGEFYFMFFHKAGQCEYFLCSVLRYVSFLPKRFNRNVV